MGEIGTDFRIAAVLPALQEKKIRNASDDKFLGQYQQKGTPYFLFPFQIDKKHRNVGGADTGDAAGLSD